MGGASEGSEEDVADDIGGCAEGDAMKRGGSEVEQTTDNRQVGGSMPPPATNKEYPNVWLCFPHHPLIYAVIYEAYAKDNDELREMF